ncbi:S8 family serine peptidase [Shouchella shacheensis]|uniref:S8 family serine peptidase n=1 Tax=Shouchella shacheensis TaxID=1649580 RepID=UPI00073FACF2|nr:S8 family serine peptidase [Shouchella shacheensis]
MKNVRTIIHALSLVLLLTSQTGWNVQAETAQYPNRPAVEASSETNKNERKIVIVSAAGDVGQAVQEVEESLPSAEIRQVYETVYGGFSLDLPERDIPKLEALSSIGRVDDVAIYQARLEGSIPFVGGGRESAKHEDAGGEPITGKGVKVAVIDTGVDYQHPDLQRNFKGGYDIIDEDEDPMETKPKQGIPTLHGTHVAGIIAANGRIQGVAPDAEIYAYRALGPGGQGTTEQVLEAIEKAVEDEVDVLNLSLGNTVNGPDWPTSLALDRAVDKGVVAVTSSGNSGPNMWTVGSPGTSSKAISVGASVPPIQVPYITLFKQERKIELTPMTGTRPWELKKDVELVNVGHGLEEDFQANDVKGKLVLAKRGRTTFEEKLKAARSAGAKGVLIYNNIEGTFAGGTLEQLDIPGASISKADGEWLLEQSAKDAKPSYIRTMYERKQDVMAPFSSRGPVTETWEVKPDLVAPGVAIESTIPNGYLGLNGTSMSSPHVAGAAALLVQLHPEWTPEQIKAALMNSTKALVDEDGRSYMPHEQGTGRLDISKALEAETLVYPGTLTFGIWSKEAIRTKRELQVTIENTSDAARTYHITPPIGELDGVQWETPYATEIPAGEMRTVQLAADIMPALLSEGLHAGQIEITGDKDSIRVPYVLFMEEPDYPRVMAFQFAHGDEKDSYYYEYYLPGGAEESGIALYDPDTYEFITYLVSNTDSDRGMISGELHHPKLKPGSYKALVFAKQDGVEDTVEAMIEIGEDVLLNEP